MSTDPEHESARDEQFVRYLLGELPEEERSRLEGLYFADPELFDRLVAAKEGLIDDYVRGKLDGPRLERFESHFLASPERRRRVETARAVRAHVISTAGAARREEAVGVHTLPGRADANRRKPLSAWWGALSPALRYALAAALVAALLVGVWLAAGRKGERPVEVPVERAGTQTGKEPAAPPASDAPPQDADKGARPASETDAGTAANTARQAPNHQRRAGEGSTVTPARPSAVAALTLTPVHTRGAGRPNTLLIPDGAARVSLRLLFGESRHGRYDAIVQTVEGAEVGSARGLKPGKAAGGLGVHLSLPAALFTKKDYIITLTGLTPEGRPEKVNEYFLQVRRGEPQAQPARRTQP